MKLARCGWMILLAAPLAIAPASRAAARQSSQNARASQADQSAPTSSDQGQTAPAQNGQSQGDSLAAAARRAREKQKEQTKPAKVWDNDNIPTSGGVDVVGTSAQGTPAAVPGSAAGESAQAQTPGGAESSAKPKKSDLEAQLKSAQENLKNLKTQLDFAQRKLALDQQSYYQNPNYASDAAGAKALKDEQSQIDAQKQQVDAAQKKVDDLQAQVQSAGAGDTGGKGAGSSGPNSSGNQNSSSGSSQ